MLRTCAWGLLCVLPLQALAVDPGYFRQPALRGDTVVFTAEGDLWTVSASGGLARRLTTHPAEETQAVLSPDGREVAFVAAYDGATDVYRMPLSGGLPQRLSYLAGRVFLQGYTPAGEILYSSDQALGPTNARVLRAVDPASGQTREWPLADVADAALSADGATLWFTQFGLALTGDNARQYRGGAMARLFRIDAAASREAERVAASLDANLSQPLAWREGVIVTADIEGIANLWSLDAAGAPQALTRHQDFEVRGAALDGERVIYQHGADLRILDLSIGEDRRLDIRLVSDFEQRRARAVKKPLSFLQALNVAGDGSRVAISARGRVSLAAPGPLRRVDVDAPGSQRLRSAVLAVDGKSLYALVDGEDSSSIRRYPVDGSGAGETLSAGDGEYRWRLYPDPTGKHLAYDDKQGRLWLLDLKTRRSVEIDHSEHGRDDVYESVVWSPDGRYLAVVRPDSTRLINQLLLLDVAQARRVVLTRDRYESFDPAFSRDGRWLYFLSNRNFQTMPGGPWGDRNTGPGYDQRTRIYALALQREHRFPFASPDELQRAEDKPAAAAETAQDAALPAVDFEGLASRLYEVPVPPGNYSALSADAARLYVLEREARADARPALKTIPIGPMPTPSLHTAELQSYQLSANGKTLMLVKAGNDPLAPQAPAAILLVEAGASAPADTSKAELRLADWQLNIDPVQEWAQMFDDAWRLHRQFSFDPNMRGVDWEAVRARYRPLLPRVSDRNELDDLLAQMNAEIGLLHSQVRGADYRSDPEALAPASLGASIGVDETGLFIARLYRSEFELPGERGPLEQPGIDAREGDRLHAINGRALRTLEQLVNELAGKAGQQVLLELGRAGGERVQRVVVPVNLERDASLRYGDWVQRTRERVEVAGESRIGYLHLRAMGASDMASFVREFYAHFDREGLIIDVRRNRGGNIDAWVIEKLLKRAWAFWQPPRGAPYWNMQQTFRGHLVVLADQLTYSDGETFTAGAKALQLGPVIGMRTAGAGIWLSDRNRLADNGIARVAEFGQFDREGRWMIEGHGVAPDIVVDNLPLATGRGGDAQLDAAIAELKRRMAEQPVVQPEAEPIPPLGRNGRG